MIIKDFQLNEKIIHKHKYFLLYGPNDGLKEEVINKNFKSNNNNSFSKIDEAEILKNEIQFFESISSRSFFEDKKIILITNVSNKIYSVIETILEKKITDVTLILNASLLDKKSKIRNLFEKDKDLVCTAFYEDKVITLENLVKQFFISNKVKISQEILNLIINKSSGKVVKIEEWGLLNLAKKIKNYKKGFYIHYKFEGNKETLNEIKKKIKIDSSIIRYLTVKYKKLDTKNEFFKKNKKN